MDIKVKNPKFWEKKNCLICEKEFESLIKRNQKTCCAKCSGVFLSRNVERNEKIKKAHRSKTVEQKQEMIVKVKKTSIERYGVDNASKSKEILDKIKESNLQKYGVENYYQSDDFKIKADATKIKRYGNSKFNNREKLKNTCLERYGVENPFQDSDVKIKIKEFWKENHNVDNVNQLQSV